MLQHLGLVFFILCSWEVIYMYVHAECTKPEIPGDTYALSLSLTSYHSGYLYRIVCIPGFVPDSLVELECESSGTWRGTLPKCEKDENEARWWILLIVLGLVVLLIPCIVPRIYFQIFDERQVQRLEILHKKQSELIKLTPKENVEDTNFPDKALNSGVGTGGFERRQPLPPIEFDHMKHPSNGVDSEKSGQPELLHFRSRLPPISQDNDLV